MTYLNAGIMVVISRVATAGNFSPACRCQNVASFLTI